MSRYLIQCYHQFEWKKYQYWNSDEKRYTVHVYMEADIYDAVEKAMTLSKIESGVFRVYDMYEEKPLAISYINGEGYLKL